MTSLGQISTLNSSRSSHSILITLRAGIIILMGKIEPGVGKIIKRLDNNSIKLSCGFEEADYLAKFVEKNLF